MNLFLFLIIICDGKRNYRDTQDDQPTKTADPVIDPVIPADPKKPASTTNAIVETTSLPIRNIQVQITGKHEITLPEDDLYLAAKITEQNFNQTEYGNSLIWGWKALSRPEKDETQMNGIDTKKLHLSKLAPGKYEFEVEVKDDDPASVHGSANFDLVVKNIPVINKPPHADISPSTITITLPNSKVVLDGSSSSDPDDKQGQSDIVSFEWAIKDSSIDQQQAVTNALDAQNQKNVKILELEMSHVGNATFSLTVTDTAGHQDIATATVVVNPENDDPPTANAGENVSINLPRSEVTLCGTNSTDDKGIDSYEWKASTDNKFVVNDMAGVREKCLKLGGIVNEGIYTYTLTVCDIKKQCDEASVQVVVHKATNIAPIATLKAESVYQDENDELHFFIPKIRDDCVLRLNGCDSHDENDDKLKFSFTEMESKVKVVNDIENPCIGIVNGIQFGEYDFKLTVTDSGDPPLSGPAELKISVEYAKPPQIEIYPPLEQNTLQISSFQKYFSIDATRSSSYDHSNLTFLWKAAPESSATYSIINQSYKSGKLEIVNFEPGSYIYNLTITDGQSQSSSKLIHIAVYEDKHIDSIFQIQIPVNIGADDNCQQITDLDKSSIIDELVLNLKSIEVEKPISVSIENVYHEHTHQDIVILAKAYSKDTPISLSVVLPILLDSFKTSGFKSFCKSSIPMVKSYVCLSDCDGHGTCNNGTNTCQCDPFWMPSPFIHQTNCAWSVVYFCLTIIGLFVLLVITGFSLKSMHQRKQKKVKKLKNRKFNRMKKSNDYTRLIQSDSDEQVQMQAPVRRKKRKKQIQKEETKNHTTPEYTDESSNTLFDMTINEQAC